jgi:hypothetical protein
MTKDEIERIVGRLYLLVVDREQQIAELQAKLAPKPPTIFSMATPREDPA